MKRHLIILATFILCMILAQNSAAANIDNVLGGNNSQVGFYIINSDNDTLGKCYRDDTGFYISCDQMLKRENTEDDQGLGAFFRYGYAPSRANDVTQFFSFGFQYTGLFEDRDEDVLGVGFAHGTLADTAKMTYNDDYEAVGELYYNAKVTDYLNISPSIQYVMNPGGSQAVSDAVVLGVRAQITF